LFFVDPPKTTKTTRAKPVFVLNHTGEVRISKRESTSLTPKQQKQQAKNLTPNRSQKLDSQKGVKNLTPKRNQKLDSKKGVKKKSQT